MLRIFNIFTILLIIGAGVWYFRYASEEQQDVVKEKGKEAGKVIAEKGGEWGNKALDKSLDVGGAALDKGLELGGEALDYAIEKGKGAIKDLESNTGNDWIPFGKTVSDGITSNGPTESIGDYSEAHVFGGHPIDVSYPGDIKVLENIGFVVGYDEQRGNPAWVGYRVFADRIEKGPKRPSKFKVDNRTKARVTHNDYLHSGYDRGHLAPNHAIALRYGVEAQIETFLCSNIVPQNPALNQGPWRLLEETISHDWANENEEVWVITGPLYDHEIEMMGSKVEIPDAFFKIVVDRLGDHIRVLAFVMKQEIGRKDDYRHHLISVDKIESLSGFDFLSEVPDHLEDHVETITPSDVW